MDEIMHSIKELRKTLETKIDSCITKEKAENIVTDIINNLHPEERKSVLPTTADEMLERFAQFSTSSKNAPEQAWKSEYGRKFGNMKNFILAAKGQSCDSAKSVLAQSGATGGGYLVPTDFSGNVARIMNDVSPIMQIANVMPMGSWKRQIPKQTANLSVGWVAENGIRGISNPAFGQIEQVAKVLATVVKCTDELIRDSAVNLTQFLSELVAEAMALEIERVALVGDTDKGDPFKGVYNSAGINTVSMAGTNVSFDDIANLIFKLNEISPSSIMRVSGKMALLNEVNAEDISLSVSGEPAQLSEKMTLCTAHGSVYSLSVKKGADFDSAHSLHEGYDYTVEYLNEYKKPAQITLLKEPAEGEMFWLSYRHWHEDKSMGWIAGQIADAAGITERQIDDVEFENNVANNFIENESKGFLGESDGLLSGARGLSVNTVFPDFISAEWSVAEAPDMQWTLEGNKVSLIGNLSSWASAYAPQNLAYGTWQFSMSPMWSGERCHYHFISSNGNRTSTNGYSVTVEKLSAGVLYLRLYRVTGGVAVNIGTKVYGNGYSVTNTFVRVTRFADGSFKLYCRPTAPLDEPAWHDLGTVAADTTYTESHYQIAAFYQATAGNNVSNIAISKFTPASYTEVYPQGEYISPVIDGGAELVKWGEFDFLQDIPAGCQSAYYIRTKSAAGADWGEWSAIYAGSAGHISGRYAQLKWSVTINLNSPSDLPVLLYWRLTWLTKSANIGMVNMQGLSGLDVLKELAALSTFEIGFERGGKFIFRKRNQDISQYFPLKSADIYRVESYNSGLDHVYNSVSAFFGEYKVVTAAPADGAAGPTSREKYGARTLALTSTTLLPPSSVDMAKTLSLEVYNYLSQAKKRAVFVTRFLPYLDLGDIFKPEYKESLLGVESFLNNTFLRIEGLEFDLENWTLRIDAAEVTQ